MVLAARLAGSSRMASLRQRGADLASGSKPIEIILNEASMPIWAIG
jgi:hypothetical protein